MDPLQLKNSDIIIQFTINKLHHVETIFISYFYTDHKTVAEKTYSMVRKHQLPFFTWRDLFCMTSIFNILSVGEYLMKVPKLRKCRHGAKSPGAVSGTCRLSSYHHECFYQQLIYYIQVISNSNNFSHMAITVDMLIRSYGWTYERKIKFIYIFVKST